MKFFQSDKDQIVFFSFQGYIFQRFFRAEGNRDYEHSGLGLSIVKHAIELHKGEIKAESVINEGLLISFSIPV